MTSIPLSTSARPTDKEKTVSLCSAPAGQLCWQLVLMWVQKIFPLFPEVIVSNFDDYNFCDFKLAVSAVSLMYILLYALTKLAQMMQVSKSGVPYDGTPLLLTHTNDAG